MNIADITQIDLEKWVPMITALIVVAFDWGLLYQRFKLLPTKEDVAKMIAVEIEKYTYNKQQIGDVVDAKLKGHCPNTIPIRSIDLKVQALENWKETHTEWGAKANEENHLALQELRYNLKALCTKMNVKYENGEK